MSVAARPRCYASYACDHRDAVNAEIDDMIDEVAEATMATLSVLDLDGALVWQLRIRAAGHGWSVEAERREIRQRGGRSWPVSRGSIMQRWSLNGPDGAPLPDLPCRPACVGTAQCHVINAQESVGQCMSRNPLSIGLLPHIVVPVDHCSDRLPCRTYRQIPVYSGPGSEDQVIFHLRAARGIS